MNHPRSFYQTNLLLVFLMLANVQLVLAYGPVHVDPKANRIIQLMGDAAAMAIPGGEFISAEVDILFIDLENDPIEELRKELKDYVDVEILKVEKRALDDRIGKYRSHIKEALLFERNGDLQDSIRSWKELERMLNDESQYFKSTGRKTTSHGLLLLGAVAQLHMDVLDRLIIRDPKNYSAWSSQHAVMLERYSKNLKEEITKAGIDRSNQLTQVQTVAHKQTNTGYGALGGTVDVWTTYTYEFSDSATGKKYSYQNLKTARTKHWGISSKLSGDTFKFFSTLLQWPLVQRDRYGTVKQVFPAYGLIDYGDSSYIFYSREFKVGTDIADIKLGQPIKFNMYTKLGGVHLLVPDKPTGGRKALNVESVTFDLNTSFEAVKIKKY